MILFFVLFVLFPFSIEDVHDLVVNDFESEDGKLFFTEERIREILSGEYPMIEDTDDQFFEIETSVVRRDSIVIHEDVERGPPHVDEVVDEVSINDIPFKFGGRLFIRLTEQNENVQVCSGTYLGNNLVITAAHCVVNEDGDPYHIISFIPGFDTCTIGPTTHVYNGIKVAHYLDFGQNKKNLDIAMIKLDPNPLIGEDTPEEYFDGYARVGIVDSNNPDFIHCQLQPDDNVTAYGYPTTLSSSIASENCNMYSTDTNVWFGSNYWGESEEVNQMLSVPTIMMKGSSGGGVVKRDVEQNLDILCGIIVLHVKTDTYGYAVVASLKTTVYTRLMNMLNVN